jgi:hypothetical protein
MSNDQNKSHQGSVACEDKALPPVSSGSTMPRVKPVSQPKPVPSKKS